MEVDEGKRMVLSWENGIARGDRLDGDGVIRGGIILGTRPRPQGAPQAQFQLLQGIDVALGLAELRPVPVPRRGHHRSLIAAHERGLRD